MKKTKLKPEDEFVFWAFVGILITVTITYLTS